MGLSLGVKPGMTIQVGPHDLKVRSAVRGAIEVVCDNSTPHLITEACRVQVAPGVYLSYGIPPRRADSDSSPRIHIEAQQSYKITRA